MRTSQEQEVNTGAFQPCSHETIDGIDVTNIPQTLYTLSTL